MRFRVSLLVILGTITPAWSQDAVRMAENFKNAQYHVTCQVDITGTLSIPPGGKDASARPLAVSGKSTIKYDERVLQLNAERKAERTVRYYRQLEFQRKVGEEEQHSKLRPEAARLVILRRNQVEVPFCPSGPLTWGEIELVRTDVFSPALVGLLPDRAVRVGDRWRADQVSIQELTDVEKIDKADFACTLEKITTLLGRRIAHVNFEGAVHGVGEDGNARHDLRGSFYFDLDANFLSYVYVKGTHHLLDKSGKPTGKIEGTFVMTRSENPATRELGDDALRGLTLEPNPDNTLLLFEHPQVGARFVYPRNWRIAGFNDKQIGIDEARGSGVLLTLAPAGSTPTGPQFVKETQDWLIKERVTVYRGEKLRPLAGSGWETFSYDAEVAKQRVSLQYFVMRQGNLGVTLTARLLATDLATTQRDVERLARSLQLHAVK